MTDRTLTPADAKPTPAPRRAVRPVSGGWLGGVAAGIADHLGWPVMLVRFAFVVLAQFSFLGVLVYGALWVLLPSERKLLLPPGLDAATRQGMRERQDAAPRRLRPGEAGGLIALIVFGLGLLWLVRMSGYGWSDQLFWPVALGCAGVALLWRQTESQQPADANVRGRWYSPLVVARGWFAVLRIAVGLLLLGAAIVFVAFQETGMRYLPQMVAVMVLAALGVGLVIAPWAYQVRRQLNEAHEAQILSDARADMAAHLHDSVLQTLALIQRQADDPKAVAGLARRQERELRTWLYGETSAPTHLKAALTEAANEIEDDRDVPVEVVVVGDCALDDAGAQLVKAAREAIMNAAKHSGAPRIDVYAEVGEDLVEVFVRDQGKGFDLDTIDADRMGVRRSIIDRMERHGGRAVIRSAPGEGTEVRLEMAR